MIVVDPRRIFGEGLTKAAEALGTGTDEVHLSDAALHLSHALGAASVAILALGDHGAIQVIADSDEHRTDVETITLIDAPVVRAALTSGEIIVTSDPNPARRPGRPPPLLRPLLPPRGRRSPPPFPRSRLPSAHKAYAMARS